MFTTAAATIERMITEWKSPVSSDEISEAAGIAHFIVNARVGLEAEIG